jgi:hypothetical protein
MTKQQKIAKQVAKQCVNNRDFAASIEAAIEKDLTAQDFAQWHGFQKMTPKVAQWVNALSSFNLLLQLNDGNESKLVSVRRNS